MKSWDNSKWWATNWFSKPFFKGPESHLKTCRKSIFIISILPIEKKSKKVPPFYLLLEGPRPSVNSLANKWKIMYASKKWWPGGKKHTNLFTLVYLYTLRSSSTCKIFRIYWITIRDAYILWTWNDGVINNNVAKSLSSNFSGSRQDKKK